MKKFIFFAFMMLAVNIASAQYRVTATVIDPDGSPEEYATYRIFAIPDTLHPVVGDLTTADGILDASLPKAGDYRLAVAAMMRLPVTIDFTVTDTDPVADLGIINTMNAGEVLNEITVSAQRPLVVKEIDRIGYDVTADEDASTSSLREILKKVPLVTVQDDGTIMVNGSENFKVYRNGRPNNAFSKNAKDIFAAIPASSIKKIEVITDPGAREDAESSAVILNIVTTTVSSMAGVTGNVGLSWDTGMGPNANAFIMTQLKKLTLSASGGYYKYFRSAAKGSAVSSMDFLESGNRSETEAYFKAGGQGGWFNMEGSLEIDTLNLLTASVNGYVGKNSHDINSKYTMYDSQGASLFGYDTYSYYPKNGYTDIDFSLDYQRSTRLKGETVTLSYRLSHTRQDQDQRTAYSNLINAPFAYSGIESDFDLNFFEHTFQADWCRPIGKKFTLDTGAKYILRSSHSNNHQNLTDLTFTETEFEHRYDILGIFADMRGTFGKFTARAGLRYEYSRLGAEFLKGDGKDFHSNLNDFVPNVSIGWKASDATMWKVTYNRHIQRPGISYLDPAVTVTPTSVSYGNPNLESMSMNNLLLNFSLIKAKLNLDLTATYGFTNDGTGTLQWVDNDIVYTTYGNVMKSKTFNFSAFAQWQLTDKTSLMVNGTAMYSDFSVNTESENSSLSRWNGYVFLRVQQKLPWELILSGNVNYFSGGCSSPYSYLTTPASNIGYGITLKRSFLKEKRLDVTFTLSDIGMPHRKMTTYTLNNGTNSITTNIMDTRAKVMIGVSWRFGNLRAMVKKTAATINNDDLTGRKSE